MPRMISSRFDRCADCGDLYFDGCPFCGYDTLRDRAADLERDIHADDLSDPAEREYQRGLQDAKAARS